MYLKKIEIKEEWIEKGVNFKDILGVIQDIEHNIHQIDSNEVEAFRAAIHCAYPLFDNPYREIARNLTIIRQLEVSKSKLIQDMQLDFELKGRRKPLFNFNYYLPSKMFQLEPSEVIERFNEIVDLYDDACSKRNEIIKLITRFKDNTELNQYHLSFQKYGNSNYSHCSERITVIEDDAQIEFKIEGAYLADWSIHSYTDYKSLEEMEKESRGAYMQLLKSLFPERYI